MIAVLLVEAVSHTIRLLGAAHAPIIGRLFCTLQVPELHTPKLKNVRSNNAVASSLPLCVIRVVKSQLCIYWRNLRGRYSRFRIVLHVP